MRTVIFALLLNTLCTVSQAAEISPSVEREIAALLDALGTSECGSIAMGVGTALQMHRRI